MTQWKGNVLSFTIEGKSHDSEITGTLSGLPAGVKVDGEKTACFMARRAPGKAQWTTSRVEADAVDVTSGLDSEGLTTGEPFGVRIANTNTRSWDYEQRNVPRPGHADYAYFAQTGHQIEPGGGAFSGRLTAPLCALGCVALAALEKRGIEVHARIAQIHDIACDTDVVTPELETAILKAKLDHDSVGGKIRVTVTGLPAGVGAPYFNGLDGALGGAYFGIPAVKAVEFGAGVEAARLLGSQNNDEYELNGAGHVVTRTNNHGGLLGGLTSGMPLVATLTFKPTPSIARPQKSVDLETKKETVIEVRGRHDPCIVPRALPVVEAVTALVLWDALLACEKFV